MNKKNSRYLLGFTFLVGAILLAACAPATPEQGGDVGAVAVGSKDFTEQFIVAEMYAQILESGGFDVERKLNLGGTPIAHQAILNADIDLYPEYTSTGLLTVLSLSPIQDAQEIYTTVKEGYEEQYNLTWLEPSPFNNTQALAMTRERSEALGITTYSDLSEKASELVLGGPAEFMEREDGIKGLQQAYGGFEFAEVIQLGTGSLRYQALLDGQIDVVVAFGTDGAIEGNDLVVLVDDQVFYPIYNIAPVVRMDTLEEYPQIANLLNELAPLLTDEIMSGLNWQVDGPEQREPADVSREFLLENGLIE